jgi:hypothetical protein
MVARNQKPNNKITQTNSQIIQTQLLLFYKLERTCNTLIFLFHQYSEANLMVNLILK